MATFHITIKSGRRGTAVEHASYIAREGKYLKKLKSNDLMANEHGNLPAWSHDDPKKFWSMADRNERANGTAYREFEVALPVELTTDQQKALVNDFITQQVGLKPFQYAIHAPMAALAGVPQPHAHIMFSDRVEDGIAREPAQHFKRYNPTTPEKGGCKKDSGGEDRSALRDKLIAQRKAWADLTNEHLKHHGHSARVDHRSHEARGIQQAPGRHLGPAWIRAEKSKEETVLKIQKCFHS